MSIKYNPKCTIGPSGKRNIKYVKFKERHKYELLFLYGTAFSLAVDSYASIRQISLSDSSSLAVQRFTNIRIHTITHMSLMLSVCICEFVSFVFISVCLCVHLADMQHVRLASVHPKNLLFLNVICWGKKTTYKYVNISLYYFIDSLDAFFVA